MRTLWEAIQDTADDERALRDPVEIKFIRVLLCFLRHVKLSRKWMDEKSYKHLESINHSNDYHADFILDRTSVDENEKELNKELKKICKGDSLFDMSKNYVYLEGKEFKLTDAWGENSDFRTLIGINKGNSKNHARLDCYARKDLAELFVNTVKDRAIFV